MCSSVGRASISKVDGRGFESLRTRFKGMNEKKDKNMSATPNAISKPEGKPAVKRPGFIASLKEEMRKVSWTTQEELKSCTKIVLGSIFFFGFTVYGIDLFLRASLNGIAVLSRLITG